MEPDSSSPRLTIMISCCRKNRWFAETLDSFLDSGYHFRNTEFLICDDGSPAGGDGDVAEAYAAKRPGLFRVIHNGTNKGAAYSHNRLLKEAKGKYILVFDCDDIFVPFDIDANLDFLDAHPEYAATFGKKHLFSAKKGYWYVSHGGDYSTFAMLLDPRVTHNGMIYRASDVRHEWAYRLPSGKQCKAAFDVSLWMGLGLQKKLYYTNEVRAFFRQHDRQITATSAEAYHQDYELLCDEILSQYPELVEKATPIRDFQLQPEEVLPFTMVLGALFRRSTNVTDKYYWLYVAEQVQPEDYAIPEYRVKLLEEEGRYPEALAEIFRIHAMHPDAPYIRMLTIRLAIECLTKMQIDTVLWQKEYDKITQQFFALTPKQQDLLNTAIRKAKTYDVDENNFSVYLGKGTVS